MLGTAKLTLLQGINQTAKKGAVIEAKFELPVVRVYIRSSDGTSHHLFIPIT